jgi:lipopolysaccharide transport system permease protein
VPLSVEPAQNETLLTVVRHDGNGEPAASTELPVVTIDGSRSWALWWQDLVRYRAALRSLAWRNLRSRYKQAGLGIAWAALQPALQVGVFTVLFGLLARVPSGGVPYPLFALAGLLPWNMFAKINTDGAVALVANQHIITKLFFPRIYLVLAAASSALVDALVSGALLGILMIWYGVAPGWHLLIAFAALFGVLIVSCGLAALLAAVNARWRDVQHTLPFILQIGLLVSPVVYGSSFVPEQWRWLTALNPMTGLIEVFRGTVLGMPMPDSQVLGVSLLVGTLIVIAGAWYFTKVESTIVDVI